MGVEFIGRGWNRCMRSLRITGAERKASRSDEGPQWDNLRLAGNEEEIIYFSFPGFPRPLG